MDSTVSVSKACFSSIDQSRNHPVKELFSFPWLQSLEKCLESVEHETKKIYTRGYCNQFEDSINAIKNAHAGKQLEDSVSTVALITGASMSNSECFFKKLCETVKKSVTPYVVTLHPFECTTVKSAMENLVYQFLNLDHGAKELTEESCEYEVKGVKRSRCTFNYLAKWYKCISQTSNTLKQQSGDANDSEDECLIDKYSDILSTAESDFSRGDVIDNESVSEDSGNVSLPRVVIGKKRRNSQIIDYKKKKRRKGELVIEDERKPENGDKPPLVVFLPEFEGFSPNIVQKLATMASVYVKTIPMVFVFGIKTTASTLHQMFPYHVSSKMKFELVHFQSPASLLEEFMDRIVIPPSFPFTLDDLSLVLLSGTFFKYSSSFQNIIEGFKICILQHFFENNLCHLCCSLAEVDDAISSLNDKNFKQLRNLPSFQKYAASKSDKEKSSLLNDNIYFQETLAEKMKDFHQYRFDFYTALKCLRILVSNLPNSALSNNLLKLHCLAMSSNITEKAEYKRCMHLLTFLSRTEVLRKLDLISDILCSTIEDSNNYDIKRWEVADKKLKTFAKKLSDSTITTRTSTASPVKFDAGEKLNRHNFKKKLFDNSQKQKKLSPYESLLKDLEKYITEEMLCPVLEPLKTLPFCELFLLNGSSFMKNHIFSTPKAVLDVGLKEPVYHLTCKCCEDSDPGAILPSMPDICIVYKLHLEFGNRINVHDWLQAYIAIKTQNGDDEQDVSREHLIQFMKAYEDLDYLGFVKTSSKKTDYVNKLP